MSRTAFLIAAIVGAFAGSVVLLAGPTRPVDCASVRWPDSMFGDMLGHVDGASSTGCVVPSAWGWTVALALPVAAITIAFLVSRESWNDM